MQFFNCIKNVISVPREVGVKAFLPTLSADPQSRLAGWLYIKRLPSLFST